MLEAKFENSILESLAPRVPQLTAEWSSATPFPHIVIDDFLPTELAEELLATFPPAEVEGWDETTYIHQRKKQTRVDNLPEPITQFLDFTASEGFREMLSEITGMPKLLADPELVGGGCHQILRDGYLDVHVDFNLHPTTGWHRRLNLLLYLNKDWNPQWRGALELWDMDNKNRVKAIEPIFNRVVVFETSEISYHGHPNPLLTPDGVTRKSIAVYYYTAEHDADRVAVEHNTLYRQTTGFRGYAKTSRSALVAMSQRLRSGSVLGVGRTLVRKASRKLRGLPPEN